MMRTCLFWVIEDSTNKIIPVFDVMREIPIRFLVYNEKNSIFEYKMSVKYKPIANDWLKCCQEGGE